MNLYQVNTTAYDEEDFLLLTDLTPEQITKVIEPMVLAEREGDEEYDNSMLVAAISEAYPDNLVQEYTINHIEIISV